MRSTSQKIQCNSSRLTLGCKYFLYYLLDFYTDFRSKYFFYYLLDFYTDIRSKYFLYYLNLELYSISVSPSFMTVCPPLWNVSCNRTGLRAGSKCSDTSYRHISSIRIYMYTQSRHKDIHVHTIKASGYTCTHKIHRNTAEKYPNIYYTG